MGGRETREQSEQCRHGMENGITLIPGAVRVVPGVSTVILQRPTGGVALLALGVAIGPISYINIIASAPGWRPGAEPLQNPSCKWTDKAPVRLLSGHLNPLSVHCREPGAYRGALQRIHVSA